jgi:hypothetical protein
VSESGAPESEARRAASNERIAAWLLLGAAAAIRLAAVSRKVLWFDEFLTADFARRSWRGLLAAIRHEAHPPLYFLSMKAWTLLFGDHALALKGFSVLAGVVALAALLRAARGALGSCGTLAAGALFAFATVQIDQSTEAKPYALLTMTTALLLAALVAAGRRPESGGRAAAAVGLSVLTAATHFYGCVAAAGLSACAVVAFRGRARKTAAASFAAAVAATLVWLPGALRLPRGASDYIRDIWRGLPAWAPIPVSLRTCLPGFRKLFSAVPGVVLPHLEFREIVGAVLVAAILAAARTAGKSRERSEIGNRLRRFLALAAGGLLFGFLLLETVLGAIGIPIGIPGRFEVLPQMGLALFLGIAVSRLSPRAAAAAIAAILAISLWTAVPEWRPRFSPLPIRREEFIVRALASRLGPDGRVDIVTLGLARPPFDYFLRGDPRIRLISFPREQQSHIGWHAETIAPGERPSLEREADGLTASIAADLRAGIPVFLAERSDPRNAVLRNRLSAAHLTVESTPFADWFFRVSERPARPLPKPAGNSHLDP